MTRFLTITALLCIPIAECSARECSPLRLDSNGAFDYVSTVIDSFAYAKTATTTLHDQSVKAQKAETTDVVSTTTDLMLSMKRASEDYECAATLVNGFAKSTNETISLSAKALNRAFDTAGSGSHRADPI